MRFQVLKYFVVLAEELHFGRAAGKLAITQPPLSTAIKALEEELGVLLFQRSKTSVQLTAAGEAFLLEARNLIVGAERAKSVVKSIDKGMTGRLYVGFGGTLIFRDLLQIVAQFNRQVPDIEIVLHEMPSNEQFKQLTRGQLNAGFAHGPIALPQLKYIPLKADSLAICLPDSHAKAGAKVVRLQDLANDDFIMFERDTNPANHDTVIGMFSRAGIYPRITHYTRNWMTTVSMVSEGAGISIVPSSMARMRMAGVRLIPLAGNPTPAHGMLVWNPAYVNPALKKFINSASQFITQSTT